MFSGGWGSIEDLHTFHGTETYCETVGWLAYENDHSLYLAGSVAPEEVGSVMQIPRVAVVERREIQIDR